MKVVAMLPVYNDEDIIHDVIEHLLSQGVELVVLDNNSTDNTYEICKKFSQRGLIKLNQLKTNSSFLQHLATILRMLYDMALVQSPDWVIRSDSDEFLESGIHGLTLKDAIAEADSDGFNLIQFNYFNFFMTDNDNESANSIREKLTYYSFQSDFQYRAWKYSPGIRIGSAGGHYPIFPDELKYKIYPRKFVFRHYPFQSEEQAKKKMRERMKGIKYNPETKKGLNHKYKKILNYDFSGKVDHRILTKYEENSKWDLKRKYVPYESNIPPKRKDVFSEDGTLKIKQPTLYEYHLELQKTKEEMISLRKQLGNEYLGKRFGKAYLAKFLIKDKMTKILKPKIKQK